MTTEEAAQIPQARRTDRAAPDSGASESALKASNRQPHRHKHPCQVI